MGPMVLLTRILTVALTLTLTRWAGCCYEPTTHACECHDTEQACDNWITTERAAHWAMCPKGPGQMDLVTDPLWYLYSGKLDPTAVSFAADPNRYPTPDPDPNPDPNPNPNLKP